MSTNPVNAINAKDTLQATEPKKNMYTLYFREGMNPHPQTKNFPHVGDLQSAVARAKRHCEVMGMRFIIVRPFMSDLDQDEKIRFGQHQD